MIPRNPYNDKILSELKKGGLSDSIKIVDNNGLKEVRKHIKVNNENIQSVSNEVNILKNLNDRRILISKDNVIIGNDCYIYTEFCEEGDLSNEIMKKRKANQYFSEKVFLYL